MNPVFILILLGFTWFSPGGAVAASASSGTEVASPASRPINQLPKPLVPLPVEVKASSKSVQGGAQSPSGAVGPQPTPGTEKSGSNAQVLAPARLSQNDPAGPPVKTIYSTSLSAESRRPAQTSETILDAGDSADALEQRVRSALEGKLGTNGSIVLKLGPDVSESRTESGENGGTQLGATRAGRSRVAQDVGGRPEGASIGNRSIESVIDPKGGTRSASPVSSSRGSQSARGPNVGAGSTGGNWAWDGALGPVHWGRIDPDFVLCANGRFQSPIAFSQGDAVPSMIKTPEFDFKPSVIAISMIRGVLTLDSLGASKLYFRGEYWILDRIQIYTHALTLIQGVDSDGSFLAIFKKGPMSLAVEAPIRVSPSAPLNYGLQRVLQRAPLDASDIRQAFDFEWNPSDLLGSLDESMYLFRGSQPHPPCHENVYWVVVSKPLEIDTNQFVDLLRFAPKVKRPTQPSNGRQVMVLSNLRH